MLSNEQPSVASRILLVLDHFRPERYEVTLHYEPHFLGIVRIVHQSHFDECIRPRNVACKQQIRQFFPGDTYFQVGEIIKEVANYVARWRTMEQRIRVGWLRELVQRNQRLGKPHLSTCSGVLLMHMDFWLSPSSLERLSPDRVWRLGPGLPAEWWMRPQAAAATVQPTSVRLAVHIDETNARRPPWAKDGHVRSVKNGHTPLRPISRAGPGSAVSSEALRPWTGASSVVHPGGTPVLEARGLRFVKPHRHPRNSAIVPPHLLISRDVQLRLQKRAEGRGERRGAGEWVVYESTAFPPKVTLSGLFLEQNCFAYDDIFNTSFPYNGWKATDKAMGAQQEVRRARARQSLRIDWRAVDRVVCVGWSDLYYIPVKAAHDFVTLSEAFFRHQVFHEAAVPTILNMLTNGSRRENEEVLSDCFGCCCCDMDHINPWDVIGKFPCAHRIDMSDNATQIAIVRALK
mmetsp:Transcript_11616/g.22583  ORF Transcript_11616/g.22583 Transcript_11616/m.22583 type:complete len:460 (+) Transcript_11616:295-1674(+)